MWLPAFVCIECGAPARARASGLVCPECGRFYALRDGIYRCVARRSPESQAFTAQYRFVRQQEGYRSYSAERYRMLPGVPPGDEQAAEWTLRGESYGRLRRTIGAAPVRVLDLGAGNGWLANRLALLGHQVVALDRLDDPADGLGAGRHYGSAFVRVQADFDALPFAAGQFALVVFNGSLHYSTGVAATLARARRMLSAGGTLVVMDSPMFDRERDGRAMVVDKLRQFTEQYGLAHVVHPNVGFLTFESIQREFEHLGLSAEFVPTRGPLLWRAGRGLARVRLGRAPASFGVWIARERARGHSGRRSAPAPMREAG